MKSLDAPSKAPEPKRMGRPPKDPAEVARNRQTRWTDADWEDVQLITMERVRELVRKEAAKERAKALEATTPPPQS